MILLALFAIVIVIYFAWLQTEGLWGNIVTFINMTFSCLLAMNFYEPIANLLDESADWLTYWFDFIALWLVFSVSMGVLQRVSRVLSGVKVKFSKQVEQVGAAVTTFLVGWLFASFMLATLHVAPLPWDMMGWAPELVNDKPNPTVMGFSPDLDWLCFTNRISRTILTRKGDNSYAFDPHADYLLRYASRRKEVQESGYLTVNTKK